MKQIATLQKTKFFGPDLGKDVAADEITGNYKEDVYSGESSMNQRHASVIEHDAQNRNSSNSIDIRTVEYRGMRASGGFCYRGMKQVDRPILDL